MTACQGSPSLAARALISSEQAWGLARIFKVLANDTRLRLLHELVRSEECCVTDLATALGLPAQAVSNQLQRLLDQGVLLQRRAGNRMYYRIADPCVPSLLDLGLCLSEQTAAGGWGVA